MERFGEDAPTREVVRRACAANGWFMPHEVVRAVRVLGRRMLRPELLAAWLERYPAAAAPRRVLVVMAGNIPLVEIGRAHV